MVIVRKVGRRKVEAREVTTAEGGREAVTQEEGREAVTREGDTEDTEEGMEEVMGTGVDTRRR